MPFLLFILALLLWEVVELIVLFAYGGFPRDFHDVLLLIVAAFLCFVGLLIVVYIAVAHAVSNFADGRLRFVVFFGLCLVGTLLLYEVLKKSGGYIIVSYPTACVFVLYLGRSIYKSGKQSK